MVTPPYPRRISATFRPMQTRASVFATETAAYERKNHIACSDLVHGAPSQGDQPVRSSIGCPETASLLVPIALILQGPPVTHRLRASLKIAKDDVKLIFIDLERLPLDPEFLLDHQVHDALAVE